MKNISNIESVIAHVFVIASSSHTQYFHALLVRYNFLSMKRQSNNFT